MAYSAWASTACLPLAGAFYLWSRWYADRMAASGQGWEMEFYFSPLAFRAMDGILLAGATFGIIGAAVGRRWHHRAVSALSW